MEVLSVEREGTLKHLKFNRPQSTNSLNAELVSPLTSAIKESGEDGTRTLVIEGNGKSFSHRCQYRQISKFAFKIFPTGNTLHSIGH